VHYRYCGWTAVKVFATDFEPELDGVNEQIEAAKSGAARSQLRERRSFVDERFRDLRELLNGKARIPRAAIRKHVLKITLTPEGRSYVVKRQWDLFGAGMWRL